MTIKRPSASDEGMTLIELVVAMAVGSVLLAGVGSVFVGMLQGSKTVTVKTSTGADVRIATEAMSRTLRVAAVPGTGSAFGAANTTSMTFYALLNRTATQSTVQPNPTMVVYTYNSTTKCLTESMTPGVAIVAPVAGGPSFTWAATATRTKCLLRTATAPTFSYYSSGVLTATPMNATTGLTAAERLSVRSVGIHLVATDPQNDTITGVQADTRITLENLL
jgi:prepilin-type N-terminal cleavage/methylation domain-containing protein